jgi:hypothetical protein
MPRSYVREARKRVGPKKQRIGPIIERLTAEYPEATIALRFRNELELLVSVMLSAQTTDVNVNRVTEKLFEKYRRPEDYLAVPAEELERDIYATGFFRQKTKAIRGTMQMLLEQFDGVVPRNVDDLVRLPGVARKTANVVAASSAIHRASWSTRTCAGSHSDSPRRRPGQDRARPDEDRSARALAAVPAPADLARPPRLHRTPPAVRGVRPCRSVP